MKKLLITVIILAIIGGGGYYGYTAVKKAAANKVMKQVANHLSKEDIQKLEKDPEVKALVTGSGNTAGLPVKTKQEAIKMLEKKFSPGEIKDFAMMAQGGLTAEEKAKIKEKLKQRLTPEEIKALEAIAIKELKNNG